MPLRPERCTRLASFKRLCAERGARRPAPDAGNCRDRGDAEMVWQRALRRSGLARIREELAIEPGEEFGLHVWDLAKLAHPATNAAGTAEPAVARSTGAGLRSISAKRN
jgi:hypothetical protein